VFQQLAMRWGLAPLQRLAADLARIESGAAERLSANYPLELAGVTRNLNTLLDASRALLTRYRNALGDLAHSLKTPLAVLRATVESPPADDAELLATVNSQLERLQHTVDYQLQRAAASGRRNLLAPVQVESVLRRVVQSLEKVYADRALAFHIDCPPDCGFHGDEGDLFELTGNLLDNASKWARTRVAVRARQVEWQGQRRLNLQVDDDGPGLRGAGLQTWIERGARAETREGGQGIGLAVVAAIVEANAGGIAEVSGELGGACISVWL
jgi:two-component system, OmpR family, sensor histidine kinase PhoQ